MSKKDAPGPDAVLDALRESARLTSEAAEDGGVIDVPALEAHGRRLDELNSSFPATREFLEARGVTKVSELDAQGRADLKAHLEKTLADALARK